jgi:hypothetical protein
MEIVFLIILIIAGLSAHFISANVKSLLKNQGNIIAVICAAISFVITAGIIGFLLVYGCLILGMMCSGM